MNGKDEIIDDLQEFVTGFDWLVYNGTVKVGNDTTGALRAPRTVIGLDSQGRLLLLVVDGCEFWYVSCPIITHRNTDDGGFFLLVSKLHSSFRHQGPTLLELAGLMITKASAQWAINMDGGGSSALAQQGRLLNRPLPWERPVATIICVDAGSMAPFSTLPRSIQ
jgi:exopolysaccharide biosynthesis protein